MELFIDSLFQQFMKLTILMGLMTLKTGAIETVNVVDFCGQNIKGDGMIVNSHQDSKKYYFVTMGTDCHLTMQAASPKDKVQFHFRFFLVYSLLRVAPLSPAPLFPESPRGSGPPHSPRPDPVPGQGHVDPCHAGSYIQFYDGKDRSSPPIGPPLCGKSPPRPVLSTGNYLTLRLVTRGTQPRVDFVGDFTSFRLGFNHSECSGEPYFTCRNGKCIPLSLVCDDKGIDNCGDGSDLEENLTTGCKGGQLVPPKSPPTIATSPRPVVTATAPAVTHMNCGAPNRGHNLESATDSTVPASLLALYVTLAALAAAVLLCWCCWSPAWFLWRVSVCRHLPCCNSTCSSCQLCLRGCGHGGDGRPTTKVTPHNPVSGALLRAAAGDATANANATAAATTTVAV